jgi:hypothetical protein
VFIKTNGIELTADYALSPHTSDRGGGGSAQFYENGIKARQIITNGPSDLLYALGSEATYQLQQPHQQHLHNGYGSGKLLNANSKICSKSYTILPGAEVNESGYDKPIIESSNVFTINANNATATTTNINNGGCDALALAGSFRSRKSSKEKLNNMSFNESVMTRSAIVSASKSNLSHNRMTQSFVSRQNSK